jgi:hypothetical protein
MRLFSEKVRRHRQALIYARQHLNDVSEAQEETREYLDANHAVIDAEKPLKWWQRIDIDLDFHTR